MNNRIDSEQGHGSRSQRSSNIRESTAGSGPRMPRGWPPASRPAARGVAAVLIVFLSAAVYARPLAGAQTRADSGEVSILDFPTLFDATTNPQKTWQEIVFQARLGEGALDDHNLLVMNILSVSVYDIPNEDRVRGVAVHSGADGPATGGPWTQGSGVQAVADISTRFPKARSTVYPNAPKVGSYFLDYNPDSGLFETSFHPVEENTIIAYEMGIVGPSTGAILLGGTLFLFPGDPEMNKEFWSPPGRAVQVGTTGLTIVVNDIIRDSRCPEEVDCVWEGSARIGLGIGTNGAPPSFSIALESGSEPRTAQIGPYELQLSSVFPVPSAAFPIGVDAYRIGLTVVAASQ